jgi:4-hydroxy-tetrahydrodipicolinate reductase
MKVLVVGSGKLANLIFSDLSNSLTEVTRWDLLSQAVERGIVIHAGSGRQLDECLDFCEKSGSVFIELSTGLKTEQLNPNFTMIVCTNTSILVLKVLNMIKSFGHYFHDYNVSLIESHQASKTSEPGTAFNLARSLKLPVEKITSIRNSEMQLKDVGIPHEYLDGHAYHKILINDGNDTVAIETKVLGHESYGKGVKKIIAAVLNNSLERRRYTIFELIDKNML